MLHQRYYIECNLAKQRRRVTDALRLITNIQFQPEIGRRQHKKKISGNLQLTPSFLVKLVIEKHFIHQNFNSSKSMQHAA